MKISPLMSLKYKKILKTLKTNSIHFGVFMGYVPNDIQLFRCIGEEEFQKLIKGESVLSSGFVTTNPMGWGATDWLNGFIPFNKGKLNYYFITFKKRRFSQIADFRDSNKDTKYKIFESYSLDDIKDIRKGNNVRGELVWADDFEEEKKKDILNKTETIMWLNNMLQANNPKIDKRTIKNELLSYQKEFPELIEIF